MHAFIQSDSALGKLIIMKNVTTHLKKVLINFFLLTSFTAFSVLANGEIGEHVNKLSDNIKKYEEEVNWLSKKVDEIVVTYQNNDSKKVYTDALMKHWEEVDFHAAIESNYIIIYASIWQGLYAVKESIDNKEPIKNVKTEQVDLNKALWQALGAVKMAAKFQEEGVVGKLKTSEVEPKNSIEALTIIEQKLNEVVAKYAEKLMDTATTIVHDTYLNLFEGVEGELIALDANLVESLEKDFNITLPKAIKDKKSVEQLHAIVVTMNDKLSKAKTLLVNNAKNKRDVF